MPVTNYVWDPLSDNVLLETDETHATTATYTQEPDTFGNLITQHRDDQTSWHHYDALGSTRQLTDDTETVTDTNLYDAWGVNVDRTGTTEDPFRWVGESGYISNSSSSLYEIRRRTYSAQTARWTAVDPSSFVESLNLFRYVMNSPNLHTDPSGLYSTVTALEEHCRRQCSNYNNFQYGPNCFRACKKDPALQDPFRNFQIWYDLEREDMSWARNLPKCPCRIRIVTHTREICLPGIAGEHITIRWTSVHNDDNKFGPPKVIQVPAYHPGAKYEIRSPSNAFGARQQCTFNASGQLMESGLAAGTADRAAGLHEHLRQDVSTWELARTVCRKDPKQASLPLEKCTYMQQYWEVRPIPQPKMPC